LGSILAAFGQVFFMNTASKLATTWFGDKERGVATAFGGLSMPVGCIIGFAMPALMITEGDSKDKFI
jgi:sugar phosphate permease